MLKFNSRFSKDKPASLGFKIGVEALKGMTVVRSSYLNFLEVANECARVADKCLMNAVNVIKNKDDTMLFRFHSETNVIYLNVYIALI